MKKISILLLCMGLGLMGCSAKDSQAAVQETAPSSDTVTIYFARHGKTMLNTVGRSQGWIDAPLTPVGVEVAENLGKGLSDVVFDKAYSSDSGRAIETAELILNNNGQSNMEIIRDQRFREYNFGTFEGMMNDEMMETVVATVGLTLDDYYKYMEDEGFVPGCELFADAVAELDKNNVEDGINWAAEDYRTVVARLTEGLDAIVADAVKNGDDTILIVSHGMSIATLLQELDGDAQIPSSGLKNASISVVEYKDGGYTVSAVNDLTYVEHGQSK